MYENLIKGQTKFDFDPVKEDTFCLGLTILEVGTGNSIQDIYDKKNKKFNEKNLQKHIQNFKKYHEIDRQLISSSLQIMLTIEEQNRCDFKEINVNIPKYDELTIFINPLSKEPISKNEDIE